jgi:hypothetical protein
VVSGVEEEALGSLEDPEHTEDAETRDDAKPDPERVRGSEGADREAQSPVLQGCLWAVSTVDLSLNSFHPLPSTSAPWPRIPLLPHLCDCNPHPIPQHPIFVRLLQLVIPSHEISIGEALLWHGPHAESNIQTS